MFFSYTASPLIPTLGRCQFSQRSSPLLPAIPTRLDWLPEMSSRPPNHSPNIPGALPQISLDDVSTPPNATTPFSMLSDCLACSLCRRNGVRLLLVISFILHITFAILIHYRRLAIVPTSYRLACPLIAHRLASLPLQPPPPRTPHAPIRLSPFHIVPELPLHAPCTCQCRIPGARHNTSILQHTHLVLSLTFSLHRVNSAWTPHSPHHRRHKRYARRTRLVCAPALPASYNPRPFLAVLANANSSSPSWKGRQLSLVLVLAPVHPAITPPLAEREGVSPPRFPAGKWVAVGRLVTSRGIQETKTMTTMRTCRISGRHLLIRKTPTMGENGGEGEDGRGRAPRSSRPR